VLGGHLSEELLNLPENDENDSELLTPQRVELLRWFDAHAPALAPLYKGALRLALGDGLPGRVHFIAHAIREIRNRLPGALGSKVKQHKADYEHLVDKIYKRWVEERLPEDGRRQPSASSEPSASGPEQLEVSYKFLDSVGHLIEKHLAAQKNREAREKSGFDDLSERGPTPQYLFKNWSRLFPNAEKFAHAWDKPLPTGADGEWVQNFFEFEEILMVFSKRSYENLDDLDDLLKRANTR